MPYGKPVGVPCVQLTSDLKCAFFGKQERPAICVRLQPSPEMCGTSTKETLLYLSELERLTLPEQGKGV
jgi:hypothetical protein